jgi:hypothetical protein
MGVPKNKGGLGFRDLVSFNKALLAKQIWRLLQQLDSLVARIFKAKYHYSCSILKATLGKKLSLAWRSLLAAQDVVKKGAIWRVGDGKSIKIWEDCWLPTPTTFKIQSPQKHLPINTCVFDLIDQTTRRWNVAFITEEFKQEEAEVIMNIPLSPLLPKD